MRKEKIKEVLKKPFVFVVLQNLVFLFVSLFVFHPHFEENDDAIMAFIEEGVYGARDSHLVYANYCLGDALRFLYRICSGVRWHSVMQYLFIFLAMTMICYLMVEEKKQGRLLSTFFLLCTFYEAYVSLQYTKTAAIASVAGYLVVFYCLRRLRRGEQSLAGFMTPGILLLVYGYLLRDSCFYLATVVFFLPMTYELWNIRKETETGHKKRLLSAYLAVTMLLVVLLGATTYMDRRAYAESEDWAKFRQFNIERTKLLDYRYDLMNYEDYGKRLSALGVTENDALLYLTWQFGDREEFTVGLIDRILDGAPARAFDLAFLKRLAAHLFEELYGLSALIPGSVCLALWLLFDEDKKNRYLILYLLSVAAVFLCYYEYSGRWNHRVVFAMVFALFSVKTQYSRCEEKKPLWFIIGVCLFMNVGLFMQDSFDYYAYMREEAPSSQALNAYTDEHGEALFLIDPFTDQNAYQYDVFRAYKEGDFGNRTYFGGWLVNSPIYKGVLADFGYNNVYRALAASGAGEEIYLVDNYYPKEKLLYLEEHYNQKFTLEVAGNAGRYVIYRLCK